MAGKLPPMNLPGPAVPWGREIQRRAQSGELATSRLGRVSQRAIEQVNENKGIGLDNGVILENTQQVTVVPSVVTGVSGSMEWVWDVLKNATTSMTVAWYPVSTSTEGKPISVLNYEVWGRPEADPTAPFVRLATSNNFEARVDNMPNATNYVVKVCAVSINGVSGAFSEEILVQGPPDLPPLVAPTDPTLESAYGVVILRYNGLSVNGAWPVHYDYTQALMAVDAALGPWVPFGTRMRGVSSVQEGNLPADATRYFKLVAYDKFGVAGPESNVVSIVVQGVDLGTLQADLDQLETDLAQTKLDVDAAEVDIQTALNGTIDGSRIISQTIVGSQILANTITAVEIGAGTITSENIGAEQILAVNLGADQITSYHVAARSIEADRLVAGSIGVNEIDPAIGGVIDISANDTINLVVGRIDTNEAGVDSLSGTVDEMTTFYQFGATGATITTPDSPFAVRLSNSRIAMQENGVDVSWWENQEMHVKSFIGEIVQLGNHQLEKYGTGTVVRKL